MFACRKGGFIHNKLQRASKVEVAVFLKKELTRPVFTELQLLSVIGQSL